MRTFKRGRAQGAGIRRGGRLWLGAVAPMVLAAGCLTKDPPEARFYDQHVQPILKNFCVGNTSPCHAIDQATGTALGNLDLTSFEGIQKRRDVLRTYGPYPHPLLYGPPALLLTVNVDLGVCLKGKRSNRKAEPIRVDGKFPMVLITSLHAQSAVPYLCRVGSVRMWRSIRNPQGARTRPFRLRKRTTIYVLAS